MSAVIAALPFAISLIVLRGRAIRRASSAWLMPRSSSASVRISPGATVHSGVHNVKLRLVAMVVRDLQGLDGGYGGSVTRHPRGSAVGRGRGRRPGGRDRRDPERTGPAGPLRVRGGCRGRSRSASVGAPRSVANRRLSNFHRTCPQSRTPLASSLAAFSIFQSAHEMSIGRFLDTVTLGVMIYLAMDEGRAQLPLFGAAEPVAMPGGRYSYVPVLLDRPGEREALRNADDTIWARMMPLIQEEIAARGGSDPSDKALLSAGYLIKESSWVSPRLRGRDAVRATPGIRPDACGVGGNGGHGPG